MHPDFRLHRFRISVFAQDRETALLQLCQVVSDAADNPGRANVGIEITPEDRALLAGTTGDTGRYRA